MFSMPPATTTSASPTWIAWAASMTALSPEPQTLLTVIASTSQGIPARIAACLAGFWPLPQGSTWPMMTSSTASFGTPARASAAVMTMLPS